MPRKISPCSLMQVCLQSIAGNMDKLWCKDYEKNFGGKGLVLYTLGPFEYMDNEMIQGVIDNLTKSQRLRRIHLDLLITSRLRRLHIQLPPTIPISPVIKMVAYRCQHLVELSLFLGSGKWSSKSQSTKHSSLLMELVQGLPNITYLNFSESSCGDDVLATIALFCKKIKVLKVKGCPVTDLGLKNLCLDSENDKKCHYLHTLDVTRTAATTTGLAEVIDKLENLQFLYHDDTGLPLWHLNGWEYQQGVVEPKNKKYKLQTLKCHFPDEHITFDESVAMFDIFYRYCPFLTTVYLVNPPSNEALLCLSNLRLKDLTLACDSGSSLITFNGGICPLLQKVGHTLEKLALGDINRIDVGVIGLHCRNLLHLQLDFYDLSEVHLDFTSSETLVCQNDIKPFTKIQSINCRIEGISIGDFSYVLQSLLSGCASLKSLSLHHLDSFSDNLLQEVLLCNKMQDLEELYLTSCDNVSGNVIEDLLRNDNQLCKMELINCKHVYRRHIENMLMYIKRNKFDVTLKWL
ncbi:uncharacterized protein LOC135483542 [Lineus longissimus]|uniref:uncharacterized protein LOC135483542 n=1 Tax=Lineus longissimus TaxID=88925 RepID=UPI002B4EF7F8